MKKQVEMLTNEQIRALVNCSPATLSRWIKRGIPCHRETTGRGGAKRLLFDREAALRWVLENASLTSAQLARALTAKASPEPTEPAAAEVNPDELDGEGVLSCLERLRRTERDSFRLLQKLKRAGDVGGIRVVAERYVAEVRALAHVERVAVDFQARSGELVNAAAVQGVYFKVITGLKNNLLGVPSSAIPLILPYLKDPDSAFEVHKIIDEKIRDALRAIGKATS